MRNTANNRKTIISSCLLALLCACLLAGCGLFAPKEPAREEITLENKYKDSSFTQKDIDSDTIQWICSAYAINIKHTGKQFEIIGGILPEERSSYAPEIKKALSDGWNIDGRDDVLPALTKLTGSGHHEPFEEYVDELEQSGLLELPEEEFMTSLPENPDRYRKLAVYRAYQKYGRHGIDGWDYCRALELLANCYVAQYINLEECLGLSLPIAQTLQKQYDNWEGVAESYLYGHQFWKEENADVPSLSYDLWETYRQLSSLENGPYSVPYDTVLEDTWTGCGEEEKEEKT